MRFFGGSTSSQKPMPPVPQSSSADIPQEEYVFDFLSLREYPPEEYEATERGSQLFDIVAELSEKARIRFLDCPDDVPAMPTMASEIFALLSNDDVNVNSLVRMINRDPRIATQILKAANSALFRGDRDVDSIRDAIVRLGLRQTGNVAAAASIGGLFGSGSAEHPVLVDAGQEQWSNAMVCAHTSAAFSSQLRVGSPDGVFLGGMLHDIGKSIALRSVASCIGNDLLDDALGGLVVNEVLEEIHLEVAQEVIARWGLATEVAAFCVDHHSPSATQRDIHVVRLASGMNQIRCNPGHRAAVLIEVSESRDILQLDSLQLRALATLLRESVDRVAMISQ